MAPKVYAEVLHEIFTKDKDERNVELIQKLIEQIDRLNDLIKDLLDTSNITEGQMILKRATFDLNRLIEEQIRITGRRRWRY